jgi:porphobilinogen deaminase
LKKVRIICRQSRLSLLQAELVKEKILLVEPNAEVQITGRSSRGDRELTVPLSALDGTDFFTEEIFEALQNDEADIAVHSLKDMSAPHFFSHSAFAIVDRDDVRDVAIFNSNVLDKIRKGETILIGTCSPRREEMAVQFLKKALPQVGEIKIETRSIRGNVEGRLTQLHNGNYDATILATAGLNRLLKPILNPSPREGLGSATVESKIQTPSAVANPDGSSIKMLLANKLLMLLPLIECVPAPCQGAIVAEADPFNKEAVELIKRINDAELLNEAIAEKNKAFEYGTGCLQKFGVTSIKTKNGSHLYAAGEDNSGNRFQQWTNLPQLNIDEEQLFSSTDFMKEFFDYEWSDDEVVIDKPIVFVANYKAVQHGSTGLRTYKSPAKDGICNATQHELNSNSVAGNQKIIIASGAKTWFELAKQGYWVTASADALGFENLLPVLQMPLLKVNADDICILTHQKAAERWKQKGFHAVANYQLIAKQETFIAEKISSAKYIFWSSFSQYEQYGNYAAYDATHICAGGETATLLQQAGVAPVIFPTIKAFEQWRKSFIRSHSAA